MRASLRALALTSAALGACGDDLRPAPEPPGFELIGHSDLGARGMNAALALAGDTAYVGSRIDQRGVAIVDLRDPANPVVVGELGPPDEGVTGLSSRELRAVPELDLLIVLNLACSPDLHGCATTRAEPENLKLYDIADRRQPRLLATYPIAPGVRQPRSPHELYLRRDGARTLVYLAAPGVSPQLEIIDVTDPSAPVRLAGWDPTQAGHVRSGSDDVLHSVAVSDDGRTAYLSHQQGGLMLADLSALPAVSLLTPPGAGLSWPPLGTIGPHSATRLGTRDLLLVTEEIYPMPFGRGCPWGHARVVDIANPAAPVVVGEYRLPENDPAFCATPRERVAYTAHNTTATADLALVTWYAGGLQAIDVRDPARPAQLAELRPTPIPAVAVEDPGLGGAPVAMWSYPIVQDGLIHVVDIRNGLYVLRYHGPHEEQLAAEAFLEGNSNL